MSPFGNDFSCPSLIRLKIGESEWIPAWRWNQSIHKLSVPDVPPLFSRGVVGLEALAHDPIWSTTPQSEMNQLAWGSIDDSWSIGPAICRPGKIIALGRTFPAHAHELGNVAPKDPLIFSKLAENIVGDGAVLTIPWQAGERFDNEIEVGALIGRPLRSATVEETKTSIAGWVMLNEFTWRSEQGRAKASGAPWHVAKNLPGCLPIGSQILPYTSLPDPRELRFQCQINGETVQEGDFTGMSKSPVELISWLSHHQPLAAGDLIALGTPKGVTTVVPNDHVEISIEGLGSMTNTILGEA